MLKNRDCSKWVAMMLPEHITMIKEWKNEQFTEMPRELVEWELEELQQTIQRATVMKKLVTLTLWNNNKIQNMTGMITGMDINKKELLLDTDLAIKRITFDKIQNAEMVDIDD
ncbi:hypothetical protein ABD87_23000 [Lysinibacillus sphaericus]|uniref:YolD-like family protein n=1 Tax=Lysinibacillus sphaericus TaxID=1421 RepID=UPI0018CF32B1|nr:YolD-like family protein [Lysinibacillus sphaericus]MBG9732295.1 hypothetical protein [Lysinibacillus sphaericus]